MMLVRYANYNLTQLEEVVATEKQEINEIVVHESNKNQRTREELTRELTRVT